jgi:zinc D-Ala-D-Ala dipeptidase
MKPFFLLTGLVLLLANEKTFAQKKTKPCAYEVQMKKQGLIDIQTVDPTLLVELKYSTTDNFTHADVYGCISHCYMQPKPAQMLAKAHTFLKQKNPQLRLLVYDGGRPRSVQQVLWDTLKQYPPDEREKYVSNPQKGSIHNYGSAVDLTISDAKGRALDMGTAYDFFGELAYPTKEAYFLKKGKLSKQHLANRKLLREVMQKAGYMPIDFEWWHFNALSREEAKKQYRIVE